MIRWIQPGRRAVRMKTSSQYLETTIPPRACSPHSMSSSAASRSLWYEHHARYKAEWHQHQDGVQPASPAPSPAPVTSTASPKPRCQYGNKCYRKNPQHMRDFDHSHSPLLPSQSGEDAVTISPHKKRKRKREKDSPEESGESSDLSSFIVSTS